MQERTPPVSVHTSASDAQSAFDVHASLACWHAKLSPQLGPELPRQRPSPQSASDTQDASKQMPTGTAQLQIFPGPQSSSRMHP